MAKVNSLVPLQGTIGGITFYRAGGKNLARKQPVGGRNLNAPNMVRVKENVGEFTNAAAYSKYVRAAFSALTKGAVAGSLTGLILATAKKFDTVSNRGERSIKDLPAAELQTMAGFELNPVLSLDSVLSGANVFIASILTSAVDVGITECVLRPPSGATHYDIIVQAANIERASGRILGTAKNLINISPLPANNTLPAQTIQTQPTQSFWEVNEFLITCVGVRFYQEVNGFMYVLNERLKSPARICDFR